jgi:uncharacterized DUF497 family protein
MLRCECTGPAGHHCLAFVCPHLGKLCSGPFSGWGGEKIDRGSIFFFVHGDEHALVQPDVAHADRLVILGTSVRARLLFVVYVAWESDDVVRVISARRATPHERKAYENA